MDQRQYRANQPCDDAIAPACADSASPAPFLGAAADGLRPERAAPLEGGVEGPRQRGHDHAGQAAERRLRPVRLSGRATRSSASSCSASSRPRASRTSCSSPATSTRSSPATSARAAGPGRVVAVEFVGGSITSRGIGEGEAGAACPATTATRTLARRSSSLLRGLEPVGRPGRPRPPRLRAGDGDAAARSTASSSAWQTIKRRSRAKLPSSRVPLLGRPRADVDQGRQRPAA